MCEANYQPAQFNYVIYQYSSGGLGTPTGDARFSYYGVGGVPTLKFDGIDTVVGGSANASAYIPVIEANQAELVPLTMEITDWDFSLGTAFAEVRLELLDDLDDITDSFIRIAVIEDNTVYNSITYRHTLRTMLPDQPLTISQAGQQQTVNVPIPMDAAWNQDNMMLIAWAQRDGDYYIFNSTNSQIGPYALVARVDGPRHRELSAGQAVFEPVSLYNMGRSSDTYEVTLDTSGLPEGWSATLSHDGVQAPDLVIPLDTYESAHLSVILDAATNESAVVTVQVVSQGRGEVVETIPLAAMTAGADILVVADDGDGDHVKDAYAPSLDAAYMTFAVWERGLEALTAATLQQYDAVLWTTGANDQSLQADDRAALDTYLYDGGRLLLAGENILQGMYAQGPTARSWYLNRLYINFSGFYSGSLDVIGVPGDPVGDGLQFTLTGGDSDRISLLGGDPPMTVACNFGNDRPAVILTDNAPYRTVLLPFGLELVPTREDRDLLLVRSLFWLGLSPVTIQQPDDPAGPGVPTVFRAYDNFPNPFNPMTSIKFDLPRAGRVSLRIYDVAGRLVRTLVDQDLPAASHVVTWDATDQTGRRQASGVYYYRLATDQRVATRKMTLVK